MGSRSTLAQLVRGCHALLVMIISPPPVKPEGTIGLHSVRPSVCPSGRHTRFLRYAFTYLDESW